MTGNAGGGGFRFVAVDELSTGGYIVTMEQDGKRYRTQPVDHVEIDGDHWTIVKTVPAR
jgi:hypothetical protein